MHRAPVLPCTRRVLPITRSLTVLESMPEQPYHTKAVVFMRPQRPGIPMSTDLWTSRVNTDGIAMDSATLHAAMQGSSQVPIQTLELRKIQMLILRLDETKQRPF